MTSFFNRKVWLTFLIIALCDGGSAFARSPELTNISVKTVSDGLYLFFDIEGAFKENIQKAILSGVPTTFTFFVTIQNPRSFLFSKKIKNLEVDVTVKYNNLKKEFAITRSWETDTPTVTDSFQEAMKLMSKIEGLRIEDLKSFQKGKTYKIKVKAELRKIKLPLYLHNVFFFVSLWDFETDWYKVTLTY